MICIDSSIFYRFSLLISLIVFCGVSGAQTFDIPFNAEVSEWEFMRQDSIGQEKDSVVVAYQNKLEEQLMNKDTLGSIKTLNSLSKVYCNRVNYEKSYDGYWKALSLAEQIGDKASMAVSYNGLAILYSVYSHREEALKYNKKSLEINKALVKSGELDSMALRSSYFPLAVHYRYEKNVEKASAYLDSCAMIYNDNPNVGLFVGLERGYLLILEGKYKTAEEALLKLRDEVEQKYPAYLVVYYTLMGDLYYGQGEYEISYLNFYKALETAKKYKNHLNFVPDIYMKLYYVMEALNRSKEANKFLINANIIDKWLYSSRSPRNRYLLEIKDKYRLEQDRQEKLQMEQRLLQLKQEESIWLLKTVVLIISLVFIVFIAVVWMRHIRRKHTEEKVAFENERRLEEQKNKEIIAIKNRELTGSTLQLVAKDEVLLNIREKLNALYKESKSENIRKLIKDIDFNKDQSWLAFETRFTAANKHFYDNLKSKYPSLKPYDLRLCALIKLDFTTKEIAKLLGISAESANTARYRLRKKLKLNKDVNLVEFLHQVGS